MGRFRSTKLQFWFDFYYLWCAFVKAKTMEMNGNNKKCIRGRVAEANINKNTIIHVIYSEYSLSSLLSILVRIKFPSSSSFIFAFSVHFHRVKRTCKTVKILIQLLPVPGYSIFRINSTYTHTCTWRMSQCAHAHSRTHRKIDWISSLVGSLIASANKSGWLSLVRRVTAFRLHTNGHQI